MDLETVIGLEVHIQLLTASKLFCSCSAQFLGYEHPNINICPICTGQPGVLPKVNARAVDYALRLAIATNCTINSPAYFARKNYLYPDLPKGYQISQFDNPLVKPLAINGYIDISLPETERCIRIRRIQLEEDAGKKIQHPDKWLIDFNRCGIPLIELVTEPDFRSPKEAYVFLKELRQTVRKLSISNANMEEGSLRCDANISLRIKGSLNYGVPWEIKNVNSFRFVEQALEKAVEQQSILYSQNQKIKHWTVKWDEQNRQLLMGREKETEAGYRYFVEPDLLPLIFDKKYINQIESALPELPRAQKNRYMQTYNIPINDIELIIEDEDIARYYEYGVEQGGDPKVLANWIINELPEIKKNKTIFISHIASSDLIDMLKLLNLGKINKNIAKKAFRESLLTGKSPLEVIDEQDFHQVDDIEALTPIIKEVLEKNSDAVKQYHEGKQEVVKFLIGQVMKLTSGKASPKIVETLINKFLK